MSERNRIACIIRDSHDWPEVGTPLWPIFLRAADAILAATPTTSAVEEPAGATEAWEALKDLEAVESFLIREGGPNELLHRATKILDSLAALPAGAQQQEREEEG